ncbi:MAG: FHA domain-containing protein [Pyrinomonadaceae bacterium]|nr:FHA domain-containing protein [Phycisphaerales bacterium]
MNVSLVMVSADGKSREIPINRLPATIGRGEECKVRVPLSAISRKHCELQVGEDGQGIVVKDLKSANGTYINGMKVLSRDLVAGDLLALGPVVFVIRINGNPRQIDAIECYAAGAVEARDQASPPKPSMGGSSSSVLGMEGVPAWKETGETKKAAPKNNGSASSKPAAPKSLKKEEDDDDGLDSLLADLDLSGLDDDEPQPPKKK